MKRWLKRNWKRIGAGACGAAAVILAPVSVPAALGVAAVCGALGLNAGQDYLAGKRIAEIVKPATDKLR